MEIVKVTNPKFIGFDFYRAKGESAFYLTVQLNTSDGVKRFSLNPYEVHNLLKHTKQIQEAIDADKEYVAAFEEFKENYQVPRIKTREYLKNIAATLSRRSNGN